jgi:hypothetical protein
MQMPESVLRSILGSRGLGSRRKVYGPSRRDEILAASSAVGAEALESAALHQFRAASPGTKRKWRRAAESVRRAQEWGAR